MHVQLERVFSQHTHSLTHSMIEREGPQYTAHDCILPYVAGVTWCGVTAISDKERAKGDFGSLAKSTDGKFAKKRQQEWQNTETEEGLHTHIWLSENMYKC